MLLAELLDVSLRVSATRSRLAKIDALAECLRRLGAGEILIGVAYLSGETRQPKLGVGYAAVSAARSAPAPQPSLELRDVDADLETLCATRGAGSAPRRQALLRDLLGRATAAEQDFLVRLLLGELRQGALEGIMLDAIARASGIPSPEVRRAAMRAGRVSAVARAALTGGGAGLAGFALTVFQPVQPMLAQPAADTTDALARLGAAAFEWKLDGARVQVHKSGEEVRVYTRNLNDVSASVPEAVEAVRRSPASQLILDGEAIALGPDGTPRAFQDTMRRFSRKLEVDALRAELPLSVYFFDCLLVDGTDLTAQPAQRRFEALAAAVPADLIVPRTVTSDAHAARAFFEHSLERGHEGLMAKAPQAPYEAGGRGGAWLKIKQANTLDLVVLAAEWGSGRRHGWLSNLHLGARDPADPSAGGFVMLGKTFKGMTDSMLAWQTERLLALETGREGHIVHVSPELVVEIAFNEIQASPHYPGGLALRFARVKRYRQDKSAEQADSIETVRALFNGQAHRGSADL
jgi:DNA ligase-1